MQKGIQSAALMSVVILYEFTGCWCISEWISGTHFCSTWTYHTELSVCWIFRLGKPSLECYEQFFVVLINQLHLHLGCHWLTCTGRQTHPYNFRTTSGQFLVLLSCFLLCSIPGIQPHSQTWQVWGRRSTLSSRVGAPRPPGIGPLILLT
jgi:hypothetical protein